MRRTTSLLLAGALAFGFVACGDDDDDGGSETTETTAATDDETTTTADDGGDSGDDGGSEDGSEAVDEYCDAVEAFVEAALDAEGNSAELAELADEAQEVVTQGQELAVADLSESDQQRAEECSNEASEAMEGFNAGG